MTEQISTKVLGDLFDNNILVSPNIIEDIKNKKISSKQLLLMIEKAKTLGLLFIDKSLLEGVIDIKENSGETFSEAGPNQIGENILELLATSDEQKAKTPEMLPQQKKEEVKVIFSYSNESTKRTVQDFVQHFTSRYKLLEQILSYRPELEGLTSISRLKSKEKKETASIIGMVSEKSITKNNNFIMTLEDTTGTISVMINKNKPDLFKLAPDIVEDEVLAVSGSVGNNILFANKIIFPDVPNKELKKAPEEVYAVFIGDTHFGSKYFLKNEFHRFIHWIRGELGDEKQKELSSKVKYLFISGDVVDGVGIYPNQEDDLDIKDIYEQYNEFVKYLKLIPSHINIIVCPGNHDAMRIAEPQPILYKDLAEPVYKLENVTLVSNPGMVNILSSDFFPGFDVLLYHGSSFIYYADAVESIRTAGGQKRPDLIMKFLLQKRHLAPTHTSTLYIPDKKDTLVIEKVPDFFITGHIHRSSVSSYKNVSLLNCSSWLAQTAYQEKVGLIPQPARAVLTNLQTREIKILKFGQEKETN